MELKTLLQFDSIVIQCHNDPDADAVASGFGIWSYLCANGKNPRLVYGGRNPIRKSNLVRMVERLEIPVEHVHGLEEEPELHTAVPITILPERKACPVCGTGRSAITTAPVPRSSGICCGKKSMM